MENIQVDNRVFVDYNEDIIAINEIAVTAHVKAILNNNFIKVDLYNDKDECIATNRRIAMPELTQEQIDIINPPVIEEEVI